MAMNCVLLPGNCRPVATHCVAPRHALTARPFHASFRSLHQPRLRFSSTVTSAAATEAAPDIADAPKLGDLELHPIISLEGLIHSIQEDDKIAAVYAIFDEDKKLQFIGFSKDLETSLRTVFTRRPDLAYFYKATLLAEPVPESMLAIRNAWAEECGDLPSGNKLAMERALWQQPIQAWSINERGRKLAATELVQEMLTLIRSRGCVEDLQARPELLEEGKVDFIQASRLSPEEIAAAAAARIEARRSQRTVSTLIDGHPSTFTIQFEGILQTRGGVMMDVLVTYDHRSTEHRVVMGREYYEPYDLEPQDTAAIIFDIFLRNKLPRRTEGQLDDTQFPVNYFACGEVEAQFPEFVSRLAEVNDKQAIDSKADMWTMNRVQTYGHWLEDTESLAVAFQLT